MPYKTCKKANHNHVWATEGEIVIERCEKWCYFCGDKFPWAWHLRRHVHQVHCKGNPNIWVTKEWTPSPQRRTGPASPSERRENRRRVRVANSQTPTPTPPAPVMAVVSPEEVQARLNGMDLQPQTINPAILETRTFVTPQSARINNVEVEGIEPTVEHRAAGEYLGTDLDQMMAVALRSGSVSEGEALYVLETYTAAFKRGEYQF